MRNRRLSTYVNLNLLKLPADAQFPPEWSEQSKATLYRSYGTATKELENKYLEIKQWKKMVDPYMFLDGSVHGANTVLRLFPQLMILYGNPDGPDCRMVVDQMLKRPVEITSKMFTEVGTAIAM